MKENMELEEWLKMADELGIKYELNSDTFGLFIEENGKERKISIEELFNFKEKDQESSPTWEWYDHDTIDLIIPNCWYALDTNHGFELVQANDKKEFILKQYPNAEIFGFLYLGSE